MVFLERSGEGGGREEQPAQVCGCVGAVTPFPQGMTCTFSRCFLQSKALREEDPLLPVSCFSPRDKWRDRAARTNRQACWPTVCHVDAFADLGEILLTLLTIPFRKPLIFLNSATVTIVDDEETEN